MGVEYKDYYKVLGVERTASADDIRKAFRKLAAKYHPDRHAGDRAMEEKFKELNEAYEVLKDPEKRRRYDALGSNWNQGQSINPDDLGDLFGQFMRGRAGQATGAGAGTGGRGTTFTFNTGGGAPGGFSDFFETLFGGRAGANVFGEGGRGRGEPSADDLSSLFGAHGQPHAGRTAHASAGNVETSLTVSLEDAWRGTTRKISFQRAPTGEAPAVQHYDVKIPAGIRDGQKIRLRGQGGAVGGRAGDILITVHIARHPRYELDGDHLIAELPLTPWEAALGARVSLDTLSGPVEVKVPAGIEAGKRLRVRGRGWPRKGDGHGDLLLRVVIQVPRELTDQERDLFERLGRVSTFIPRR